MSGKLEKIINRNGWYSNEGELGHHDQELDEAEAEDEEDDSLREEP